VRIEWCKASSVKCKCAASNALNSTSTSRVTLLLCSGWTPSHPGRDCVCFDPPFSFPTIRRLDCSIKVAYASVVRDDYSVTETRPSRLNEVQPHLSLSQTYRPCMSVSFHLTSILPRPGWTSQSSPGSPTADVTRAGGRVWPRSHIGREHLHSISQHWPILLMRLWHSLPLFISRTDQK
jgi:hypothetical protein